MSDNPFASKPESFLPMPPGVSGDPGIPQKSPGGLTAILVICLILGILGLGSTCFGGLGYVAASFLEDFAIEGAADDAQRELQKSNFAAQKKLMIPGLALIVVNLVVATLLFAGSILGLKRKESGRKLLGYGLIGAILYSFPKMGFYIYQQMVTSAATREVLEKMSGEEGGEQIEMIASISSGFGWVITIFFVIVSLVMLGFYIWAKLYLGKDRIVELFATQPS
jgi:hypothetical protein